MLDEAQLMRMVSLKSYFPHDLSFHGLALRLIIPFLLSDIRSRHNNFNIECP